MRRHCKVALKIQTSKSTHKDHSNEKSTCSSALLQVVSAQAAPRFLPRCCGVLPSVRSQLAPGPMVLKHCVHLITSNLWSMPSFRNLSVIFLPHDSTLMFPLGARCTVRNLTCFHMSNIIWNEKCSVWRLW